jgi:hypothetical protein
MIYLVTNYPDKIPYEFLDEPEENIQVIGVTTFIDAACSENGLDIDAKGVYYFDLYSIPDSMISELQFYKQETNMATQIIYYNSYTDTMERNEYDSEEDNI